MLNYIFEYADNRTYPKQSNSSVAAAQGTDGTGGSTSCARSARCGCASCCYSGFPSHTVSQVCVGASECVCVCVAAIKRRVELTV